MSAGQGKELAKLLTEKTHLGSVLPRNSPSVTRMIKIFAAGTRRLRSSTLFPKITSHKKVRTKGADTEITLNNTDIILTSLFYLRYGNLR